MRVKKKSKGYATRAQKEWEERRKKTKQKIKTLTRRFLKKYHFSTDPKKQLRNYKKLVKEIITLRVEVMR